MRVVYADARSIAAVTLVTSANAHPAVTFETAGKGEKSMASLYQIQTTKPTPWFSLKWLADPGLQVVVIFCALGLLVSACVMLRYPEFGAIIAQCRQF